MSNFNKCLFYAYRVYMLMHSFKKISQHLVNIKIYWRTCQGLLHANNFLAKKRC